MSNLNHQRSTDIPDRHSAHPGKAANPASLVGYGLAILAACGWATGGLVSKWLFTVPSATTVAWPIPPLGIPIAPTTLSGARALAAALILGILLALFKPDTLKLDRPRVDLGFLVPFGAIALAGMHFTYFKTISLTNVATAILLEYLAPVLTLAFSVVVLRHRLNARLVSGVILSIVGCAVVVGAFSPGGLTITPAGLAWGLVSAVFFALYSILGGLGSKRFAPFTLLFYGLASAAIMWCLALGPMQVIEPFMRLDTGLAVLAIACISTIIPFGAYLYALQRISPTNATITAMLEPVVAGVGAFVFFGEPVGWTLVIGGIIVLSAIGLIQIADTNEFAEFPPQD